LTSRTPRAPSLPLPDQHDRHGARALVLRERTEEVVDRQGERLAAILVGQQQAPARDDHLLARRQQIDRVALDRVAVARDPDRDVGPPREQRVHHALEVGRQVLEHDERHARVPRHRAEQRLERLEPARRRPHADDERGPRVRELGVRAAGRFACHVGERGHVAGGGGSRAGAPARNRLHLSFQPSRARGCALGRPDRQDFPWPAEQTTSRGRRDVSGE
jgi:hypothetical protein